MMREVLEGFELTPDTVRLVPNGVDTAEWAPPSFGAAREPLVLAWGRVQYEKGFQVLAQAMARLRGRVPGVSCLIAGRGPYLPELQSQVDIEGVGDLVQLAGYVPRDDLRALLHRAGCVVIPSLYEPFGVVALEALAADAPVVSADTGGLAEIMQGSGAALLFEPGNAARLAEAIERVLIDTETSRSLRARARDLLEDRYSWDAIAEQTISVYGEVG
jgi:glycogen(starch) synthase